MLMGDLGVSESLRASATRYWAADGARWAEQLPTEIARACSDWGLRLLRVLPGTSTAYVAEVQREDGSVAVLKIAHPSIEAEGAALRAYGGIDAIECFSEADHALLLERCLPGTPLRALGDEDQIFEVTLDLLDRLWKFDPPVGIPLLADHGARLVVHGRSVLERLPELRRSVLGEGIDALEELSTSFEETTLLHGDLHPGNILSSVRSPYLATDPKPLVGDRAYEIVPLLIEAELSSDNDMATGELERRVRLSGDRLGLDPHRIARWGLGRRSDWALFCFGTGAIRPARVAAREAKLFSRVSERC